MKILHIDSSINGTNSVTLTSPSGNLFFRLQQ